MSTASSNFDNSIKAGHGGVIELRDCQEVLFKTEDGKEALTPDEKIAKTAEHAETEVAIEEDKVAKKNGVNLMSYDITLDAGFNRHGVMLKEEVDLPFEDMKLTIEVTTDASDEEMELLAKELAMFCPISKMIIAAGTKLETIWVINRPDDK